MAFLPILFRIQELDSKMSALKRTQDKISADPNLTALLALHQGIVASLAKIEVQHREQSNSQRQRELDLKVCQEHLRHEETKLYDGSITSPRGLEQVQQKVAEYKGKQTQLEDEILTMLEDEERMAAEQIALQKRLTVCDEETAAVQQGLKQQSMEITLEQNEINYELEELKPQVPVEWLERYKKIANAHFGIGISRIKANSCGACHVALSDSMLRKAKQGEDTLIFCENCGRILFF